MEIKQFWKGEDIMATWQESHKEPCGHCRTSGKCDCGTCGVETGEKWSDTGMSKRRKGKCSVCGGSGYFYPNPRQIKGRGY